MTISSDHAGEKRDGGEVGGVEAESQLRQLDLEALHRASQREFSSSDASDAIGMDSAAPTYYRKKLYTSLSEMEQW